jgi:hypothetical protein
MIAANDGTRPDAKALFCSACGSADVTASALAGGDASCNVCSWKGKVEDLAAFHFTHGMGDPEMVFRQFFLEIRKLLSMAFAKEVGLMLIKWGFLEEPTPKNLANVQKTLARYIAGIAKAIAESIARTRSDIEKEARGEQPSA